MYAAIGYLEKKQLQRNINLANTRGKEVINEMGEKAYMLDDGYRVLDDIKNTPRYWRKAKHECPAGVLGCFLVYAKGFSQLNFVTDNREYYGADHNGPSHSGLRDFLSHKSNTLENVL